MYKVDASNDHLPHQAGEMTPYSEEPLVFRVPEKPASEEEFMAKVGAITSLKPARRLETRSDDDGMLLFIWTKQVYTAEVRQYILSQVREHWSPQALILRADTWVNQPPL